MAHVARPIGDLDLHLFGEGTHRRLWELLGPQPLLVDESGSARSIRFGVWAPNAQGVAVIGDWNDWIPEPLAPVGSEVPTGIWTMVAPEAQSGHRYKFVITTRDGRTLHKADPMARQSERPPSDASVVPTSGAYRLDRPRMDARSTLDARRHVGAADLRGPSRLVEAHGRHLGRTRDRDRRSRRPSRVHPRRADADRRAPVRWLVGVPGVRLLLADGSLRRPGWFPPIRRRDARTQASV